MDETPWHWTVVTACSVESARRSIQDSGLFPVCLSFRRKSGPLPDRYRHPAEPLTWSAQSVTLSGLPATRKGATHTRPRRSSPPASSTASGPIPWETGSRTLSLTSTRAVIPRPSSRNLSEPSSTSATGSPRNIWPHRGPEPGNHPLVPPRPSAWLPLPRAAPSTPRHVRAPLNHLVCLPGGPIQRPRAASPPNPAAPVLELYRKRLHDCCGSAEATVFDRGYEGTQRSPRRSSSRLPALTSRWMIASSEQRVADCQLLVALLRKSAVAARPWSVIASSVGERSMELAP